MCEGNRITSGEEEIPKDFSDVSKPTGSLDATSRAACEAAGHDCSSCASGDGKGGCAHGHEHTMEDYLDLTYKQNQVIALKLEAYAKDLQKAGRSDIADQLLKAIPEFEKGNMFIGIAKSML